MQDSQHKKDSSGLDEEHDALGRYFTYNGCATDAWVVSIWTFLGGILH